VRHLQTVGARLALALLVVVAAVLAFVYLVVTPSLEDRLVDSRKDQVATVAERAAASLAVEPPTDVLADGYASASNTRVVFFEIINRDPLTLVEQGSSAESKTIRSPCERREHTRRRRASSRGPISSSPKVPIRRPTRSTWSSSRARSRTLLTASPSSSAAC
jgi:hypothetical protein